jgi:hypothetical protein
LSIGRLREGAGQPPFCSVKPGSIKMATPTRAWSESLLMVSRSHSTDRAIGPVSSLLELYLEVLEGKPGAPRDSKPLAHWPPARSAALVAAARLGWEFGCAKLEASVSHALELGSTDIAAFRRLLMND